MTTEEEAKYWRDKHVMETAGMNTPKWQATTSPEEVWGTEGGIAIGLGVNPENYDKIKKEEAINRISKKIEDKDLTKSVNMENFLFELINEDDEDKNLVYESLKRKGFDHEKIEQLRNEGIINVLTDSFAKIKNILRKYIDTAEENYSLIALWIIGTYAHSSFSSYPYLFFNAMKGSGKSKTIKLIVCLSHNGHLIMDLTDAVLFRTANGSMLGIDEFENVAARERTTLRTLLNSAYKKGVKVVRMCKQKIKTKKEDKSVEKMVPEEFEIYAPIVMANIYGLDDVLSDRCISIILEKSTNERINRLIEDFENDQEIREVKEGLNVNLVKLVQLVSSKNIIRDWNDYINFKCSLETTQTTLSAQITPNKLKIFEKIYESDIKARHLELFFPLFIISSLISDELLDKTIETAKNIVSNKKNDDLTESRDVALIEFVSTRQQILSFISVAELTRQFKDYMQEEEEQYQTITSKWVGKALKRLNLTIEKRRLGKGVQVILNVAKAQEKIKLFKTKEKGE